MIPLPRAYLLFLLAGAMQSGVAGRSRGPVGRFRPHGLMEIYLQLIYT